VAVLAVGGSSVIPCRRSSLAKGFSEFTACPLTTMAYFCANAAVLVARGVPVALLGTSLASGGARFQHSPGQVGVIAGVPGQDTTGGLAHVRAVEVGADAFR
jgi:hypothetical protein